MFAEDIFELMGEQLPILETETLLGLGIGADGLRQVILAKLDMGSLDLPCRRQKSDFCHYRIEKSKCKSR